MLGDHIHYSNMTPREEFRLNGTLCEASIEALIVEHEDSPALELDSIECWVSEAKGCFPDEDFLTSVRSDIQTIANRLRGRNKLELMDLVEKLGQIESEISQQAEYGADELKKALDCLKSNK